MIWVMKIQHYTFRKLRKSFNFEALSCFAFYFYFILFFGNQNIYNIYFIEKKLLELIRKYGE